MIIRIMDWNNTWTEADVGEIDDIVNIELTVISGDEVLEVLYKDGTSKIFDSSDCRIHGFFDMLYTVYDVDHLEDNLLMYEPFLNRNNSYWYEKD